MEDLNSQQIVLLTLLVSFVTSIATGIVTVSLLEQAPEPVTQTINRVVEKTVERVVTEPAEGEKIIEKEVVTVIVNEEDAVVDSVEKNSGNIAQIYSVVGDLKQFVARGLVINTVGNVLTDGKKIDENKEYVIRYADGSEYQLEVDRRNDDNSFVVLNSAATSTFSQINFANSEVLKLGQTVVSISGQSEDIVSTGIVSELESGENGITHVKTSINGNTVTIGSIILSLKGEVVGMKIEDQSGLSSFVPATLIKDFLISGQLISATEILPETE